MAVCRIKDLDPAGQVAWAKVAVAADPQLSVVGYPPFIGHTGLQEWMSSMGKATRRQRTRSERVVAVGNRKSRGDFGGAAGCKD
jgi:hypothetical protein